MLAESQILCNQMLFAYRFTLRSACTDEDHLNIYRRARAAAGAGGGLLSIGVALPRGR